MHHRELIPSEKALKAVRLLTLGSSHLLRSHQGRYREGRDDCPAVGPLWLHFLVQPPGREECLPETKDGQLCSLPLALGAEPRPLRGLEGRTLMPAHSAPSSTRPRKCLVTQRGRWATSPTQGDGSPRKVWLMGGRPPLLE